MSARIGIGHDLGLVTKGDTHSWATFSPCERYRYALARLWDDYYSDDPWAEARTLFVGVCLNPSTATHDVTDNTVKKLCHYAKREGCGGLVLGNAFAWRSRHPEDLRAALRRGDDPIGEHNDEVLRRLANMFLLTVMVGGWGSPKWACLRHRLVSMRALNLTRRWHCLGVTHDGHPQHPLFLRNDAPLVP